MNIVNFTYYINSVTYLVIGLLLLLLGGILVSIIRAFAYEEGHIRLSIISTIIGILIIFLAQILIIFSHIYDKKYDKQVYEQCEKHMKEKYDVSIIDYDELYENKGSIYIQGGDAKISTYFYEEENMYYVEYYMYVLENGIINYQTENIYKYGD